MAGAGISDAAGFSMSVKRFMKRRRYKRVNEFNGGRKRLREVRLGGRNGRRVWKLKFLPILKLRSIKSAVNVSHVKSLPAKIKDGYAKLIVNLGQSRFRKPPAQMGVEEFNNKIIVEIYKSFGRQVQVSSFPSSTKAHTMLSLNTIVV